MSEHAKFNPLESTTIRLRAYPTAGDGKGGKVWAQMTQGKKQAIFFFFLRSGADEPLITEQRNIWHDPLWDFHLTYSHVQKHKYVSDQIPAQRSAFHKEEKCASFFHLN